MKYLGRYSEIEIDYNIYLSKYLRKWELNIIIKTISLLYKVRFQTDNGSMGCNIYEKVYELWIILKENFFEVSIIIFKTKNHQNFISNSTNFKYR